METTPQEQHHNRSDTNQEQIKSTDELKSELERLSRELAAAQQERSQSAAYGLELLNEKENLERNYQSIEALYEQSKRDLQELREAWNKAVNEQRVSATTVFEKEVQLLNDSDALAASLTHAKQETEKELKSTKSQLDSAITEKDRYLTERDELSKKVSSLEQERKTLKAELKDVKGRETKLFNENSELEEENVSLQKQVANLRSAQVEFESSKHEIQRLQEVVVALNSQVEEMVTLRRITERQMQEALEALQSEREQKYALRKELDKRNSADPLLNWTSLAALKGSPHLANLALRGFGSPRDNRTSALDTDCEGSPNGFGSDQDGGTAFSDQDHSYDVGHELEMPSIEGSLFDEVHLTEIKKLQQNLEEKENQRSNLNTKLIEIQHKLDSKSRKADDIGKKLTAICSLVEEIYNESDIQKLSSPSKQQKAEQQKQQLDGSASKNEESVANLSRSEEVTSTTNDSNNSNASSNQPSTPAKKSSSAIDDFDNVYSHLQALFNEFKSYQEMLASNASNNNNNNKSKDNTSLVSNNSDMNLNTENAISEGEANQTKKLEAPETLNSDDVQSLRTMLYKKHEQLKSLRTILKSNKESAEVALKNLKSKYDMEKAIVAETMTKLRHEHKRLNEDAATFASLRSHFSARIEEYNSEIEKLQSKLAASEQEKNTLNSILRMAIEQKVMLTQKLEALEMDREDSQQHRQEQNGGGANKNSGNGANGQQPRSGGFMRGGRGGATGGGRNTRPSRVIRPSSNNGDRPR